MADREFHIGDMSDTTTAVSITWILRARPSITRAQRRAAADEIDRLETELAEAHTHFAIQEGRLRTAFAARDAQPLHQCVSAEHRSDNSCGLEARPAPSDALADAYEIIRRQERTIEGYERFPVQSAVPSNEALRRVLRDYLSPDAVEHVIASLPAERQEPAPSGMTREALAEMLDRCQPGADAGYEFKRGFYAAREVLRLRVAALPPVDRALELPKREALAEIKRELLDAEDVIGAGEPTVVLTARSARAILAAFPAVGQEPAAVRPLDRVTDEKTALIREMWLRHRIAQAARPYDRAAIREAAGDEFDTWLQAALAHRTEGREAPERKPDADRPWRCEWCNTSHRFGRCKQADRIEAEGRDAGEVQS